MQLPAELATAIHQATASFANADLARAAGQLTGTYRGERNNRPHLDQLHRAAYLLTRLPATYAVLARVLPECKLRIPNLQLESMLDLGAGPGTALWAAIETFPELKHAVLVEDQQQWIEIGKRLAANSEREALRSAEWRAGSVAQELPAGSFDLITLSYVLNEVPSDRRLSVAQSAWERTSKAFLIVEPGTPAGFKNIREIRADLIAGGAHIVGPCPHANACPMSEGDWCHFAERLSRSAEHRLLKNAELGYEDEKYSYVVFARQAVALPAARVLRHPRKHSGHIELELCTTDGLARETVSRKQGERYRQAKRLQWGDEF